MKKLSELIRSLDVKGIYRGDEPVGFAQMGKESDPVLEGIAYDSRKVSQNSVFVCISGFNVDGHKFIPDAIARGARVIVAEKKQTVPRDITLVIVQDSRIALARISAEFYGYPDRKLRVIGVTGTTGKTTTTYLIKSILEKYGRKAGLIGTIVYQIGTNLISSQRTTPESLDLEIMFRDLLKTGAHYAVMEVSSHSLMLHRVDCIEFDQAIFTNLGLDHLDFHNTMEEYLNAKVKLFRHLSTFKEKENKFAIVNLDDPHSREVLEAASAKKITYGFSEKAQVYAKPLSMDIGGITFELFTPEGTRQINMKLTGKFNIYNALAATASAMAEGIPLNTIKEGIEAVESVPGRFEIIKGKEFNVIVDYAHTPEALRDLLIASRALTRKRLIVVFGCGGERDRSKRPLMGEIAARLGDCCILTSDNPRREDPMRILLDVESGIQKVKSRGEYYTFIDRGEAIQKACAEARKGDLVVIAGKGHETYQLLGDKAIHFDDRETVRKILKVKD